MSESNPPWHAFALYLGIIGVWSLVAFVGLPQGDFANYWTASNLWWEGADLNRVYDYRWFTDQAARLGFGDQLVGYAVLSPPSALLLAPFLGLGLHGAQIAWMVLQGFCALATGVVLCRWLQRPLWMGPAFLLGAAPLLQAHLQQGQMHLPVVLLLALGMWGWTEGKDRKAGICIGLAIGLKIHAWPLAILALILRRWLLMGWLVGTLFVGGAVSIFLLGWSVHSTWLTEIAPAAARGFFIDPWNVAFQSVGHGIRTWALPHPGLNSGGVLSLPELAYGLPAALQALVVGLSLIPGFRWSSLTESERDRTLAAVSISALIAGPLLASYHLLLVLPALAMGADRLDRQGGQMGARLLLILGLLVAWWPVSTGWPASSALIPMVLMRFWLLLFCWVRLMPWSVLDIRQSKFAWMRNGVFGLSAMVGILSVKSDAAPDSAQQFEVVGMPLVASDLLYDDAGALWFSGLPTQDTPRVSGRGWVGYQLRIDEAQLRPVYSDPLAHIWSPLMVDGGMAWTRGPGADLTPRSIPCGEGRLEIVETERGPQVGYFDAAEQLHRLTWTQAHHQSPACDRDRGRVWFLSDRGVGVRALRLWWAPLPDTSEQNP